LVWEKLQARVPAEDGDRIRDRDTVHAAGGGAKHAFSRERGLPSPHGQWQADGKRAARYATGLVPVRFSRHLRTLSAALRPLLLESRLQAVGEDVAAPPPPAEAGTPTELPAAAHLASGASGLAASSAGALSSFPASFSCRAACFFRASSRTRLAASSSPMRP